MEITTDQLLCILQKLPSPRRHQAPTIDMVIPEIIVNFKFNPNIRMKDNSELDYITFHKRCINNSTIKWVLKL